MTRRCEADLLDCGHAVVRVHTPLMAGARRSARERGKSDPIDAEAVARVAPREPDLPKACLDGPSRDFKLLVYQRRPVAQRTAIGNKLRWFLHELAPELAVASRGLHRPCILDHLAQALIQRHGTLAAIAAELVADCRRLSLVELQPSWSASSCTRVAPSSSITSMTLHRVDTVRAASTSS